MNEPSSPAEDRGQAPTGYRFLPRRLPVRDSFARENGTGPFERLADAIADMIRRPEAPALTIALEGPWGSGKSTVIKFVEQRLPRDSMMVVLNTWEHQGDSLRRAFLEALIEAVKDRWATDSPDREPLAAISSKLSGTVSTSQTEERPLLTAAARRVLYSLLCVPLSIAFANAALREDFALWGGGIHPKAAPLFFIAMVLAFAPLIAVLSSVSRKAAVEEREQQISSLLALIRGGATKSTSTITRSTPNPTSREFSSYFREVLGVAMKDHPNRKLVLVLDNLDRVAPDTARAVWSTMQTFLAHDENEGDAIFDRLWFIVPYDPKGIAEMFGTRDESDGVLLRHLQKAFDVRFHVPMAALADWRRYFDFLLKEAFPGHDRHERHEAYRTYEAHLEAESDQVTPRDLRAFVNQMVSVYAQWQGTFSLAIYAEFVVATRQPGESLQEKLLHGKVPSAYARRNLGEEVGLDLASLTFNVPRHQAMEVLLTAPIAAALESGDGERLSELESTFGRPFWDQLERIAKRRMRSQSADRLALAARAVSALHADDDVDRVFERITRDLRRAFNHAELWHAFDDPHVDGTIALASWPTTKDRVQLVALPGAAEWVSSTLKEDPAPLAVGVRFLRLLHQLPDEVIGGPHAIHVTAEHLCEFATELHASGIEFEVLRHIEPRMKTAEIVQTIAQSITRGEPPDGLAHAAMFLEHLNGGRFPTEWSQHAVTRLSPQHAADVAELATLVGYLVDAAHRGNSDAKSRLESLGAGPIATHAFQHLAGKHRHEAAAVALAYLSKKPGLEEPQNAGNARAGHQTLLKHLNEGTAWLVGCWREPRLADWAAQVLPRVLMAHDNGLKAAANAVATLGADSFAHVGPAEIVTHWLRLHRHFHQVDQPGGFEAAIRHLVATDNQWRDAVASRVGWDKPNALPLYKALSHATADETVATAVVSALGASKDGWPAALTARRDLIAWAVDELPDDQSTGWTTSYRDAVVQQFDGLLDGTLPSAGLPDTWASILLRGCGDQDERTILVRQLIQSLEKHGADGEAHAFQVWGEALLRAETPALDADLITAFVDIAWKNGNDPAITWSTRFLLAKLENASPNGGTRSALNALLTRVTTDSKSLVNTDERRELVDRLQSLRNGND